MKTEWPYGDSIGAELTVIHAPQIHDDQDDILGDFVSVFDELCRILGVSSFEFSSEI